MGIARAAEGFGRAAGLAAVEQKGIGVGVIIADPLQRALVFDMDETLIHSQMVMADMEPANAKFSITLPNGGKFAIGVRPYMEQCLEHLGALYEIVIFTAAD